MKKIFTFFLALVASAGTLFAASGTCGDNLTWELNSSGVLTISGSGDMTDWIIEDAPWYSSRSSIKTVKIGNSVTSIGRYAFYNCNNISSVTIGSSVKSINYYAFKNCYNLLSVIIPNSVISIGNEAFHTCSSLAAVSIGEGITSTGWGTNVFYDCNNLESIVWNAIDGPSAPFVDVRENIRSFTFGGNVQKIPAYLCMDMSKLTTITIPNSVTTIGYKAFINCTGLTTIVWNAKNCSASPFSSAAENITSFTFGNEVESIPSNICQSMNRLTEITIPNSVKSIGSAAFAGCSGLSSMTIPNSVTSIGHNAFSDCTGLKSVTIGNSVKTIEDQVFYGCTGLTAITIPNSVTSIGKQAFCNCSGLTSVTIGESVTSMGADVFTNCSGLKTIVWNAKNCSAAEFPSAAIGNITSFTFGNEVENIPAYLCMDMSKLTTITIPNSVTTIGYKAFSGCTGLTDVTIGTGVTSFGNQAFDNCTGLKTIVWNAKNCSATEPFNSAKGTITSFTFGNEVESIPDNLCIQMSKLTTITIPNSVTSIGDLVFSSCSGLKSVTIGSSVTSIEHQAFYGCSGLTSITSLAVTPPTCGTECFFGVDKTIPVYVPVGSVASYKKKGEWAAFYNIIIASGTCGDNLTWVLDGDGVLTIKGTGKMTGWVQGKSVPWYDYRASIKSVVIEAGVTSIGSLAFSGYTSITSVTIPAGITKIGSYAFYGCTGLKSITIPDGVTTLEEGAFQACTGFTTITLPASVNTLGENALSGCSGLQSITCEATTPPHCDDECFVGVTKSIPVYVPYGTVDAYNNEAYWNYFTNIQEMSCYLGSGSCGDNLTWSLPCSGVLTISGTGKMADYTSSSAPWNAHKASINSVVISDGVTGIGESAFENCSNMTSVTLPNSVISVGAGAFRYCSGLSSPLYNENVLAYMPTSYSGAFVVPDGIKSIAGYAFSGCNKISSVTIPNSVTSLGKGAFYECTGIQSITSRAATPPACGSNCFYYVPKTIPVYVPAGTVADYKAKDGWKDFGDNIQEIGADQVAYELVDLSKESLTSGQYLIVFDDNKAHAAVSGSDLIASSDELTITGGLAYVAKEAAACAVTIAPLGTDSFSIRLADGTTYLDLQKKNSVATSATASAFAITDAGNGDQTVEIAKYLPSESKTYVLKHNGNYFRMYSNNLYTLPKLYRKKIVKYTITWKMDDGTVIDQTKVEAGVVPTHADPTKAATAEYTYTFAGWEPKVVAVTGDATYTAVFKETKNSYTITWKMDDGSVIAQENYNYGDMPSHAAPVKESTAQYTYTFTGWTPALTSVTGDATYTAVFSATERSYTVTWLNWDGSQLAKESYKYGATPSFKGATPSRPATAQNTFTFTGWSPAIAPVSGDVTYKAQFSATGQTYTITWKMDDGSVIAKETYAYGDMPNHTAPVKEATTQYTYTFEGWTPAVVAVTSDATYTAVFKAEVRNFTVSWLNWDGSELAKESYAYGTQPAYKGATPTRPATEQFSYTFTGWSPAVAKVTGDVTYTATFKEATNTFTITWKMDDGSVIAKETYAYGDMPSHAAPVKEQTAQYTYTFSGWNPAIVPVTEDATYTAVFKATVRSYKVTFLDKDGKVIEVQEVLYNEAAVAPQAPEVEGYVFIGWDTPFDAVKSDLTVKALYEEVKDYTPSNLNALLVPKADDMQITLSWDKVEGAVSYELRVLADDVELFSQNTMTQNIISSPLSDIVNTYKITPGTYTMTWFVRSTDALGHAISDWAEGPQFEITVKGQGFETTKDEVQSVKIYRNGMIFILRGDKIYTVTGQEVK